MRDAEKKREDMKEIIDALPDTVVERAYVLNLGCNGPEVQMCYDPKALKQLRPGKVSTDPNGFLEACVEAGGSQVRLIMT